MVDGKIMPKQCIIKPLNSHFVSKWSTICCWWRNNFHFVICWCCVLHLNRIVIMPMLTQSFRIVIINKKKSSFRSVMPLVWLGEFASSELLACVVDWSDCMNTYIVHQPKIKKKYFDSFTRYDSIHNTISSKKIQFDACRFPVKQKKNHPLYIDIILVDSLTKDANKYYFYRTVQ